LAIDDLLAGERAYVALAVGHIIGFAHDLIEADLPPLQATNNAVLPQIYPTTYDPPIGGFFMPACSARTRMGYKGQFSNLKET
jgi:hypothetical protein